VTSEFSFPLGGTEMVLQFPLLTIFAIFVADSDLSSFLTNDPKYKMREIGPA
jgi:hypothetical protein